ncbi:proteinase inhibitor I78 [Wenjunlia tyrosinilytica]|jgi:hypothetical protein|uniref:Proteinase inhibitor I78 n=1 Tax=Wenjunlia tyrosinilytica TaxID=1544741 RepID=A0A917ZV65_9ACTN|nr:proteinase inhibitor I78 [Wenjunlia tyrosinilytica]GGO95348.1 hypothetical protein GCM10012280_52330 [Wenjunlia tyrosinilytica]
MAHIPPPTDLPEDPLDAYVGMAEDAAQRRASAKGWAHVRTLPPDAIITMEYLVGRINFLVQDGRVTRAWAG